MARDDDYDSRNMKPVYAMFSDATLALNELHSGLGDDDVRCTRPAEYQPIDVCYPAAVGISADSILGDLGESAAEGGDGEIGQFADFSTELAKSGYYDVVPRYDDDHCDLLPALTALIPGSDIGGSGQASLPVSSLHLLHQQQQQQQQHQQQPQHSLAQYQPQSQPEYVNLETAHDDIIAGALHGAGLHTFTDYDFAPGTEGIENIAYSG